jgi:hypothetical protein
MFSGLDRTKQEILEEFVAWRNLQALRAALAPAARAKKAPVAKTPARRPAARSPRARAAAPKRTGGAKRGAR